MRLQDWKAGVPVPVWLAVSPWEPGRCAPSQAWILGLWDGVKLGYGSTFPIMHQYKLADYKPHFLNEK